MSFYHGKRALAQQLSARINASDDFTALHKEIEPLVAILQEINPSLTCDTINWITVADYMNCKREHSHEVHDKVSDI